MNVWELYSFVICYNRFSNNLDNVLCLKKLKIQIISFVSKARFDNVELTCGWVYKLTGSYNSQAFFNKNKLSVIYITVRLKFVWNI